jgi:basic amino acid/polyamine antiporter, APA family
MTKTNKAQPVLGLWMLTALVAGNMIGSGVFLLPSSLAAIGSIGILAWMLTSVGAIFLALVFAKLSMWIPKVGGPYAYCREAFGEFVGFQIAYNYWIAVCVGNAAIVVALLGYLAIFFPKIGSDPFLHYVVGIGFVWFLTFLNAADIRQAGIFQLLTTIIKVLPLLIIGFVGIFFIHPHNFTQFNITGKSNWTAFSGAATLTLWSFIGLESATVPAEAVIQPTKTIPRATIIGTALAAVIYILSTVSVMGIIGVSTLKTSTAPYADAANIIFNSSWASWGIALIAVVSCVGALNGWVLLQGQVPYAAAKDKLFPQSFARATKAGTPITGLFVSSILVSLLLLLTLNDSLVKQFTLITLLATLASLIPYFFTAMAELMLLIRLRKEFNRRRFIITALVAIIAGIYAFWAIYGSGVETVYYGTLLFFSGVPVYIWMKWRESFD